MAHTRKILKEPNFYEVLCEARRIRAQMGFDTPLDRYKVLKYLSEFWPSKPKTE